MIVLATLVDDLLGDLLIVFATDDDFRRDLEDDDDDDIRSAATASPLRYGSVRSSLA